MHLKILSVKWRPFCPGWASEWVIKFNGLSGDSGHRGPYSLYKPCNHSLYIGIIIFPHIDNPQSTGHNLLKEKIYQKRNTKKSGKPLSWLVIGNGNSTSVYNYSKHMYLTSSLDWNRATDCNNKHTNQKKVRRKDNNRKEYKESNLE